MLCEYLMVKNFIIMSAPWKQSQNGKGFTDDGGIPKIL